MRVTITRAAEIITQRSGHLLRRRSLYLQVIRGNWSGEVNRCGWQNPQRSDYLLELSDVEEYAKTYCGFKRGAPPKNARS